MRNWERQVLLALLWPVVWLQGRHVRRVTQHMPEPTGSRSGVCGQGSICRVLVAGDSGAAGVGVTTQAEALCGQLVRRLSQHHTVEWCVLAVNGLGSPGLVKLLEEAPITRFDVVILSMGANDVTCLCTPQRWVQWQTQLAEVISERFGVHLLVHSAVPPMHACMALPQPLRWFMGRLGTRNEHAVVCAAIGSHPPRHAQASPDHHNIRDGSRWHSSQLEGLCPMGRWAKPAYLGKSCLTRAHPTFRNSPCKTAADAATSIKS